MVEALGSPRGARRLATSGVISGVMPSLVPGKSGNDGLKLAPIRTSRAMTGREEGSMNIQQTVELRRAIEPSLRGRVAIVTGAGQGIGRVFAKAFALAGATPVIAERNHHKGRAVAAEIGADGGEALAIHTDVADPGSIAKMVAEVDERFGRIDILVNNAGIFSTLEMRPFEQIPLDEWDEVL